MADIFDEINDDLRHEKLRQFWKENGPWIIGCAVGAVLLTGAQSFWRYWEHKSDVAATVELIRLVDDPSGLENFAGIEDKSHATIAHFAAAGAYLEQGEKNKAIALYDTIAKTSGIDMPLRDLARVLSISQRLDKDSPDKLLKELAALSGDDGTWRYTAWELEALLAVRQGNLQKAMDALAKITSEPLAPLNVRSRALILHDLYRAEKTYPKN
ncbi:MAG: tetratricopeptide repeat protein [Alphaproteobacteria bacterium]|nr:tetratricopeptide repeat protein [Alphaproteobacteria bacterium]